MRLAQGAAAVALFRFFCLASTVKLRDTEITEFSKKLLLARPTGVRFFSTKEPVSAEFLGGYRALEFLCAAKLLWMKAAPLACGIGLAEPAGVESRKP